MKKRKGKKGISPLVSVVLLIMLVLVVIVGVFKLSRETVESGFEKSSEIFEGFSSCEEVKYKLLGFRCEEGRFYLKINNEKNINFEDGFTVRAFFNEDVVEGVSIPYYTSELLAYEIKEIGGFLPTEKVKNQITGIVEDVPKHINKIEVIPKVKIGKEFSLCMNKKQILEVIGC